MSAAEFSAALRNKVLIEWFKNEKARGGSASKQKQEEYSLANINVLVNPVNLYRSGEQTSEKTAFIITQDTVKDLVRQFHGVTDEATLEELSKVYFNNFRARNVGVKVSRKKITVGSGIPAIYFPNISFDSITNLVNNVMNIKSGELQKYYEKGHVIGLTTELLQKTSERISKIDTTGAFGKKFLLDQLDNVIAYYKRLDLASANLRPAEDVKLYATFEKRINKNGRATYLVELQPKASNQESSREIQATLGSVRKLFSPGNISEKAVIDIIDTLKAKVSDPKFQQDLIEMRSSPSFKDMLAQAVVDSITGKSKDIVYQAKGVLVGTKQQPTANLSRVRIESRKKIAEAKKVKAKLTTRPAAIRDLGGRFYSLTSLQTLLDANLVEKVKQNMGRGDRRDILNLQTGRFAESVKVERLSQSRKGMITAFYSYMKYPYATFSQGGRQEFPRSRDPKLLIARSIRDIAGQQVANRLRSVQV
jgi:hypothetical protein